MSDLGAAERIWHDWIVDACTAVDVAPESVNVQMIHGLTKRIAHKFERPMAPVGAFILGLALGEHPDADLVQLRAAIEDTMHQHARESQEP